MVVYIAIPYSIFLVTICEIVERVGEVGQDYNNTQHGMAVGLCMLAIGKFLESLSTYIYTRLIGGGTWPQTTTQI
jgi:hypothetical protein